MKNLEIEAITAINAALGGVDDAEIRQRVLRWANDKFNFVPASKGSTPLHRGESSPSANVGGNEIPGIARLGEDGALHITIRDLKAKSANDAAIRLAHVAIRAYQQLTGEKTMSSKKILLPALNNYRIYDGNTRAALAREKGLIRKGDELDLDQHAQNDAAKFMAEILDDSVTGKWVPKSKSLKRAATKQTTKAK